MTELTSRLKVRIEAIRTEAEGIKSFVLAPVEDVPLPDYSAGAHIDVFLESGLVRQYSLINDPAFPASYFIAVLREADGRGGSQELHDATKRGDILKISRPRNKFPIAADARRHVFIAGGIGITPILSMSRTLIQQNADWQLHYCTRDRTKAAFLHELDQEGFFERTVLYFDGGDPTQGLNVEAVVAAERRTRTHLYCCGPAALMDRVASACRGWSKDTVHFERFAISEGNSGDAPFDVEIASTGQVFTVPHDDTILNVLRRHGKNVPFLCTQGVCGTCVVEVLEGTVDHRDSVLFEHERDHKIVICCSRAASKRLKLAL